MRLSSQIMISFALSALRMRVCKNHHSHPIPLHNLSASDKKYRKLIRYNDFSFDMQNQTQLLPMPMSVHLTVLRTG